MDIATIIGLVLALIGVFVGYTLEGGNVMHLIAPTSFLIVMGGTIGAATLGMSMSDLKGLPKLFIKAFKSPPDRKQALLTELVELAELARRDGLLALENRQIEEPFLKRAMMLVVDGTDPETTRDILAMDLEAMEARHEQGYGIFNAMGAYAPTFGIIGTVMGLVHVLGNLGEPETLGHSIAVAFIATLYGVMSANLVFLPIATKLKLRSKLEVIEKTMAIEGTLAIQAGDNPRVIKEKLSAYIPPAQRGAKAAQAAKAANAGSMQPAEAGD
jgi:chemotaxis protein MotA